MCIFAQNFKTLKIKLKMVITEDNSNVYIEDYIIPKGREKTDIKARENVVWAMLGKWLSKNPLKRKKIQIWMITYICDLTVCKKQ